MGLMRFGPPTELILQLRDKYELKHFIETGTYLGNTAVWAASYFDNVITVEYSRDIYEETVARHRKIQNIDFMFSDSRTALEIIIPELTGPAIFWLDSHWSGGLTYGEDDECPLIEEINELNKSTDTHFLLIDDARLFTSPPPRPNQIEQWPSIDRVIEALKSGGHRYYIVIIEDVVIAVPEYAKDFVASYCQEVNTKTWEGRDDYSKESAIKQGGKLITQGIRLIGRSFRFRLRRLASNPATEVISR